MADKLPVPESEQRVLDNLIRDLNETYPDKVIKNLGRDHKKWDEKVTRLYKNIGYENRNDFLNAYGFTVEQGKQGRTGSDLYAIVDELISRYEGDKYVTSVDQLKEENPDLAPKFKNIQNKSKELFGMSFNNYLKEKGVFQSNELAVEKRSSDYKAKLDQMIGELKNRYEGRSIPKSIAELKRDNADLDNIMKISLWITKAFGCAPLDYLVKEGLMQEPEVKPEKTDEEIAASNFRKLPVDQKLAVVTESLKNRVSEDGKAENLTELCVKYHDLPNESTIKKWTKEAFGENAKDYFIREGIIMSPHEQYLAYQTQLLNDGFNPPKEIKSGSFYDYYDYFDTDALLMDTIGSTDETILPKNKKQIVAIKDHSFTVKNKLGNGMKKLEMPYSGFYFDLGTALDNLLEVEEVQDRMLQVENTSDAWVYARPVVDPNATTISSEIAEKRYRQFAAMAHIISKEDVLESICKIAPKKKDGTFHKGRITRIASTATVEVFGYKKIDILYEDNTVWEILAKADTDYELSIYVENRRIDENELQLIYKDFISSQWRALGLEKYVNIDGQKAIIKDKAELFRIEGDRLFVNDAPGKDEFLNDLKKYRSATVTNDEICIGFPYKENYKKSFKGKEFIINVEGMHNAILDAWSSMLAFEGLYDYISWKKKSQKATKQVHEYPGCTVISHIPTTNEPGDPNSDCRVLRSKKYNLKESVLRFAKLIDSIEDISNQLIESAPRDREGNLRPGEYAGFLLQDVLEKEFYVFPPRLMLYGYMLTGDDVIKLECKFWKKK